LRQILFQKYKIWEILATSEEQLEVSASIISTLQNFSGVRGKIAFFCPTYELMLRRRRLNQSI